MLKEHIQSTANNKNAYQNNNSKNEVLFDCIKMQKPPGKAWKCSRKMNINCITHCQMKSPNRCVEYVLQLVNRTKKEVINT